MKVRVVNETLIFGEEPEFGWEFIGEHLLNAVSFKEFKYWEAIQKQAEELGLEFAKETYLEDLKNSENGVIEFDI